MRWRGTMLPILGGAVAFLVPALLNYNFILNHFMRYGGFLLDSGYYASQMYRNLPLPQNPPAVGSGYFFAQHFSPHLMLFSALSYLADFGAIDFFALYTALTYGGLALALYVPLTTTFGFRRPLQILAATLLSLLLAFNGITLAGITYPHIEAWFGTMAIAYLFLMATGHPVWAVPPFVLALIVREDMGFHLVAVLGLWLVYRALLRRDSWRALRPMALYLAAAFAYSVAALVIQRVYFPAFYSLREVYLGQPAFAHVTWSLLWDRLAFFARNRQFVWLPLVLIAVWAWRTRQPLLVLGYIAYVPWLAFNLLAVTDGAGELSSYHTFPFLVSLVWPLVVYAWQGQMAEGRTAEGPPAEGRTAQARPVGWGVATCFAATVLLSSIGFGRASVLVDMVTWGDLPRAAIGIVQQSIARQPREWGRVSVGTGVAALDPRHLQPGQVLQANADMPTDTLLFFSTGISRDDGLALVRSQRLQKRYQVAGTNISVASNRALEGVPPLGPLLRPAPLTAFLWAGPAGTVRRPGFRNRPDRPPGLMFHGPYLELPKGKYQLRYRLGISGVRDARQPVLTMDVAANDGQSVLARRTLSAGDLGADSGTHSVTLDFSVGTEPLGSGIEFRVWHHGNARVDVVDADLEPLPR